MDERVDSEVNFRIKRPKTNHQTESYLSKNSNYRTPQTVQGDGDNNLLLQDIDDPRIENYIQRVINKRWQEKEQEIQQLKKQLEVMKAQLNQKETGFGGENFMNPIHLAMQSNVNQNRNTAQAQNLNRTPQTKVNTPNVNAIKSPSDTTLYTPGLRKTPEKQMDDKIDKNLIDKISELVESIRFSRKGQGQLANSEKLNVEVDKGVRPGTSQQQNASEAREQDDARAMAQNMIKEAE